MKPHQDLNTKLGILGGGQLGRMLIQKAIDFNIETAVLDPDPHAPCKDLATDFTQGDFKDYHTVYAWGQNLKLITIEIEHVNTAALAKLEQEGVEVYPQPTIISMVQDKASQKEFYRKHQIPTAHFQLVDSRSGLKALNRPFPYIIKTHRAGYDGKGVMKINNASDLLLAFDEPMVVEDCIDFEKEISVLAARNKNGETVFYPPVEMEFNSEANLVEFLYSPASISKSTEEQAISIARRLLDELGMVGLLAVEMFVTKAGEVLVNEIAPRPHNSGHQTIEGNVTSQYEQHLRAIFNLPLGSPAILRPSVMVNILGEKNHSGPSSYEGLNEVLAIPGTYIHLYGKKFTKPFRKMGHVTITANTMEEAKKLANQVKSLIRVISVNNEKEVLK